MNFQYHVRIARESDGNELHVDVGLDFLGAHLDVEPVVRCNAEDDGHRTVRRRVAPRRFEETPFRRAASRRIDGLRRDQLKARIQRLNWIWQ